MKYNLNWGKFFACFALIIGVVYIFVHSSQIVAGTVVTDTFTRTVSGGWGTNNTGQTYTLTGNSADFNVNGSGGTMNAPTLSTSRAAVVNTTTILDTDITFRVSPDKLAAGISQEVFFTARQIASTDMYRGKMRLTPSGTVTLQASKVVGGVETFIGTQATVVGLTYSGGSYIWVRGTLSGTSPTTIQLKAWADGSSEPVGWSYTSTDSEASLQVAGQVGLRINLPSATSNAPVLFTFDDFAVSSSDPTPTPTPSPSPSPTPPPQTGLAFWTDGFSRTVANSWGTPDTGGDYVITSGSADNYSVGSGAGTIIAPTSAVSRSLIVNNTSQQDVDIKFQTKVDKLPVGNAMEIFWLARYQGPDNHYRGKIRLTSGSGITMQATKQVGGVETLLGVQTSSGVTLNADSYIWVRSQVVGINPTTINMKVWDAAGSEPVDWQFTITDAENVLQAAGSVGLRLNAPSTISNAPITTTFDNINTTTGDGSVNSPTAPAQAGTVIATDTFTRSLGTGWGSADTGGAYSIVSGSTSNFAVNGAEGSITSATSSTSRAAVLAGVKQRDIDMVFKIKIDKVPTGSAAEAFWLGRWINTGNQYRGKIRFTTSSSLTLQATSVINGSETLLGSQASTGVTFTPDTYINIRTQIIGTSPTAIYMKAWAENATEPLTWQYTYTDYSDTALQTQGSIGLRTNIPSSVANAPIIFSFDNLNVTTSDIDIYDPAVPPSPSPSPSAPSAVTATVNLVSPLTTSSLSVGATHTQESADAGGDSAAVVSAKNLLANGVTFQNQHIIGFGADNLWDDPAKSVADWNWTALDNRVKLMRDTGGTPVLTLCCAATWMVDTSWYPGKYNGSNTDWGLLEKAPLDAYEADFAYMAAQVAARYNGINLDDTNTPFPKIVYFQVWNEFKGFWDSANNQWNSTKYNRLYGLVYDAVKSVRSDAVIGGPYVRFSKYLYPHAAQNSSVTDPAYGTIDQRDLNAVSSWLTWLTANPNNDASLKADFIAVDSNINAKDVTDGTFPPDIFAATKLYSDLDTWMNTQMTSILARQLPIWWSEDYVGKVNGDPTLITPENVQPAALATMLSHHVLSGTSVSLRWGPEEQVNSSGVAQSNHQNLYSSTKFAGGGQPYTNYTVYKDFRDYFGAGTAIYPVVLSPATDAVSVLASSSKALLINKVASGIDVTVSTTIGSGTYALTGYEVRLVDLPSVQPVPTSAPGSTSSSNNSSASPGQFVCSATAPSEAPNLFQVNVLSGSEVLLYYSPGGNPSDHYVLEYGESSGNYVYGVTYIPKQGDWVQSFSVASLQAKKRYYFRIRAANGCADGLWSNEISAVTGKAGKVYKKSFVRAKKSTTTASRRVIQAGPTPTPFTGSVQSPVVNQIHGEPSAETTGGVISSIKHFFSSLFTSFFGR